MLALRTINSLAVMTLPFLQAVSPPWFLQQLSFPLFPRKPIALEMSPVYLCAD